MFTLPEHLGLRSSFVLSVLVLTSLVCYVLSCFLFSFNVYSFVFVMALSVCLWSIFVWYFSPFFLLKRNKSTDSLHVILLMFLCGIRILSYLWSMLQTVVCIFFFCKAWHRSFTYMYELALKIFFFFVCIIYKYK